MSNLNTYLTKTKHYFDHDDLERLDILTELHHTHNMSISEIAEVAKTYPNKILRDAKKLKFKQRSRSDIQKALLAEGKKEHPTKGKKRGEETKLKISESMGKQWDNMSKKERERRSEISKETWESLDSSKKLEIKKKANEGIRKASKDGSKLEKYLYNELTKEGYSIQYHKEQVLANEKLQLDMFIPAIGVVIEVDGPSHFENIWGAEHRQKTFKADNQKNGLCIGLGLWMIRVLQTKRLSQRYQRNLLDKLSKTLYDIKNHNIKKIRENMNITISI